MTITVANTSNSDLIGIGRERQNEIAHALTTKVVTVDSNAATGNATVNGSIQANSLFVDTISGGDIGSTANLTFATNATFTAKLNMGHGSNVLVTTGNATHRVLTVNSADNFSLFGTKITFADHSDVTVTTVANADVLQYSNAAGAFVNVPGSSIFDGDADTLDGYDSTYFANSTHTHPFADLTSKPTTLAGYGVDAVSLGNSTVNASMNSTSMSIANSTSSISATPASVTLGNVTVTTSGVTVGNSTVNVAIGTVVTVGNTTTNTAVGSSYVKVGSTAGDIASPANGSIWYNTSTGAFRAQENGATKNLISVASTDNIKGVYTQVFTANGTYTPHSGMVYCEVVLVGGGGGGGAAQPNLPTYANGGGAGGTAIKIFTAAQVGSSQTMTIGIAGLAGNSTANATSGSNTTFGSMMTAEGGYGSPNDGLSTYFANSGGVVNATYSYVADRGYSGFYMQVNNSIAISVGGMGASTPYGAGGCGCVYGANARAGSGYGAGGGGAARVSTAQGGVARNGSAGAPGIAIITEYCTQ